MTFSETYLNGKQRLVEAGIESPAFDCMCIFEKAFGMNRQRLAVVGNEQAENSDIVNFNNMIQQRCARRPLQYIIGEWSFMDMKLEMGEGVLIAREDTEVLVRSAAEVLLMRKSPRIIDLCAGTGAVGLGIASMLPKADVQCVEFYDIPFSYLQKNIEKNGFSDRVRAVRGDALNAPEGFGQVDAILSNPPYIETDVIETLQEEVRQEPKEALDGGADGLDYYRAICRNWLGLLKDGGYIFFEIGEGQSGAVTELLEEQGVEEIKYKMDFNGICRVVYGRLFRSEEE